MNKSTGRISLISVMTALTVVFTLIIRYPVVATNGYISLIDASIVFSAIAFGPVPGFLIGALGSALSDIIGGYALWAVISFVVHGLEGLLIGIVARNGNFSALKGVLSVLVSLIIVPFGYFLLTGLFLVDFKTSLVEVPGNLLQSGVGSVIGVVLYKIVLNSYPKLKNMRW